MPEFEAIKQRISGLAHAQKWDSVQVAMQDLYPSDLADIIEFLEPALHRRVFQLIDEATKPDVLAELEGRASDDVLASLSNAELAEIVEDMAPDDAADVLADLSEERSEIVLDLMEDEESEDVRELLKYNEDSAGGIMTTDIVALQQHLTVSQAIESIAYMDDDEPFYYAYVIDESEALWGYIGLWELLKVRDREQTLGSIAHRQSVTATTEMDQEEVAKLMSKYDVSAIPVLDSNGKLMGRITWDDVMDVMEEEASEDIFRFAGSDDAELDDNSPLLACRVRLPWLLITLAAGFVTSTILRRFMSDFSQILALSFFVPIVLAMGGNTGIQSSTLIIRSLALGSLENKSIAKLLGREIAIGAIMGVFCGLIMGMWAHFLLQHSGETYASTSAIFLAFTVGLALLSAMTFAAVFGAFVPIMLNKWHVDPAVASGPFVTASNDILALLIYYGVALSLINLYSVSTGLLI